MRIALFVLLCFALAAFALASAYARGRGFTNIVGNTVSNTHAGDQLQVDNEKASVDAAATVSGDGGTNVRINGRDVNVPSGGSVHKVVHDTSGTTSIDISNSSSSSEGDTTIDLQVESHSTTSGYSDST